MHSRDIALVQSLTDANPGADGERVRKVHFHVADERAPVRFVDKDYGAVDVDAVDVRPITFNKKVGARHNLW